MRIALAQINPTVGDLAGNEALHLEAIAQAKKAGATLVVFPELSVIGYPPKDLLLKPNFVADAAAAVGRIATACIGIDAVVGMVERNVAPVGRPLFNTVGLLRGGRLASSHYKSLLPFYDVFDESRYFEPAPRASLDRLIDFRGVKAGITICEDLWNDERLIPRRLYHDNPLDVILTHSPDLLLNLSASPFVVGKPAFRDRLFGGHAVRAGVPLVVVNQVGGNDELIFDGNSAVYAADGSVLARAAAFETDLVVVDVPVDGAGRRTDGGKRAANALSDADDLETIRRAIVLGVRDYARKTGFRSAVLGLSGGIDSALTAALAVEALGPSNVFGVAMPSRFPDHSIEDAKRLAAALGIGLSVVPIGAMHDAFERTLAPQLNGNGAADPSIIEHDLTSQNLQARIRGTTLMAFSNRHGHLLLTTGNKSEIATGYCTLYGDMCGGLAVISDVPKTTVWELSRHINRTIGREVIPVRSIEKVPSAELRPNQTDQDSLPPYETLDAIVQAYVEEERSAAEIIATGLDAAVVKQVIRLIDRSEYKRRQAAPGLKVTSRAFGFGRRMPIAQGYRSA